MYPALDSANPSMITKAPPHNITYNLRQSMRSKAHHIHSMTTPLHLNTPVGLNSPAIAQHIPSSAFINATYGLTEAYGAAVAASRVS